MERATDMAMTTVLTDVLKTLSPRERADLERTGKQLESTKPQIVEDGFIIPFEGTRRLTRPINDIPIKRDYRLIR